MATLTLRSIKGSPLTITEVDDNFTALNTDVGNRLLSSSYTAADVLTKIKTVDGIGSGLDADLLDWPLLNRSWVATDYFYPLGLRKKKKLNHFLGSLKLSPAIKSKTTVLCSDSKIAWVVGQRIDERFKITPQTKRVVKITFLSKS